MKGFVKHGAKCLPEKFAQGVAEGVKVRDGCGDLEESQEEAVAGGSQDARMRERLGLCEGLERDGGVDTRLCSFFNCS